MSRSADFRFHRCIGGAHDMGCGYVKLALEMRYSRCAAYCPHCRADTAWSRALSTRTHSLSGKPLKAKR